MRFKRRLLLGIVTVISLLLFSLWLNRAQSYCATKIEALGGGGQSSIYQCGNEILKFYRRPWEIDLVEMRHKLEALNKLDFVPKTTQFYRNGFRQEMVRGPPGSGFSDLELHSVFKKLQKNISD